MLRDTLKTLLSAWGPSGNEHAVAEAIKALVAPHVDDMHVDALGNLIVQKCKCDSEPTFHSTAVTLYLSVFFALQDALSDAV